MKPVRFILKHTFILMFLSLAIIMLFTGCATDFKALRKEHAKKFTRNITDKTSHIVSSEKEYDIDSCIKIALENNLDIKISEIKGRLAGIDRKIAFSGFLPYIDVNYIHTEDNKLQMRSALGSYIAMADQQARVAVIEGQLAVFNPETWFLYGAYKKGEDIEKLLALRVKQAIRLQVTALYLSCLTMESNTSALKTSVKQAQALAGEMEALYNEGLILKSDLQKSEVFLTMQQTSLSEMERQKIYTKSQLLEAMGLSPLYNITLRQSSSISIEKKELDDMILTALLNRPELKAADRSVAIHSDSLKMAISAFIPRIFLVGNYTNNRDSYLKYRDILTYGVSGILTVFDGFRNIYEYKAAKEENARAMIEREQTCMKIMLEVINARQSIEREDENRRLMKLELEASESRLNEVMSLWQEGMMTSSEKLEAVSRNALAKANMAMADYRYQVSAATMSDVMGITGKE